MLRKLLLSAIACFSFSTLSMYAAVPSRPTARWAVLASTKTLMMRSASLRYINGVSMMFGYSSHQMDGLQCLRVLSPVPHGINVAKKNLLAQGGLPSDLFMSNGVEFEATLWQPDRANFPTLQAAFAGTGRFETSGLQVTMDTVPADSDMHSPRIMGKRDGQVVICHV